LQQQQQLFTKVDEPGVKKFSYIRNMKMDYTKILVKYFLLSVISLKFFYFQSFPDPDFENFHFQEKYLFFHF